MFKKVNVPVLGLVENMSYFTCNNCRERHEIFSSGNVKKEADKFETPFLGELPIDIYLRINYVLILTTTMTVTDEYKDISTQLCVDKIPYMYKNNRVVNKVVDLYSPFCKFTYRCYQLFPSKLIKTDLYYYEQHIS